MLNTIRIIGLFLLVTVCFSCSSSESEPSIVGTYEYMDETNGKIYEAKIENSLTSPSGLYWHTMELGFIPITVSTDLTFRVSDFEFNGDLNTIKGELKGDELHVTREIFELQDVDLEMPIMTIIRVYIKK